MKILILGLNYAPEPVGIGPYSKEMAVMLAKAGHEVTWVAGKPYYPYWKSDPAYAGGYKSAVEEGVAITRCPIYVPEKPSGLKRLLHHFSFALSALPVLLSKALRNKPDLVLTIAPSLIATPVARIAAALSGAPLWLHIQDLEVEAALATGLLKEGGTMSRLAFAFERLCLTANKVSTISPQMCSKLASKNIPLDRIVEFRNWASIDRIRPLAGESSYRAEWGIDRPHVALYSGNIANKQGVELLVEAATALQGRRDLMFVICGNGANREALVASAKHLDNIQFRDLQPMERLSDLLGLATVHLLPQIAGAADLVLPSKLANMLASGRAVVATALPGTGIANEVEGCGLFVPPADVEAFAGAITQLIDNPAEREAFGRNARARAEERWSKDQILHRFETQLQACVAGPA